LSRGTEQTFGEVVMMRTFAHYTDVVPAKTGTHNHDALDRTVDMGPGSRSPESSPGSLGRDDSLEVVQ
jgi:hypothetical protein